MTNNYEKTDTSLIRYNEDGSITSIPFDPANADYQRYLNPEKVEHLTEIPTSSEA